MMLMYCQGGVKVKKVPQNVLRVIIVVKIRDTSYVDILKRIIKVGENMIENILILISHVIKLIITYVPKHLYI